MNSTGNSERSLIIIPTFNESLNISILLGKLSELRVHRNDFDVLVVDDGSPDQTSEVVHAMNFEWVEVLNRMEKQGLGSAYKDGFRWGSEKKFKFFIEMDADGSHRVEDLQLLLDAKSDIDLVIGSRWISGGKIENWPRFRKWLSIAGNFYARKMLHTCVNDSTSGFRRLKSSSLAEVDLNDISSKGYGFQIEIVNEFTRKGFSIQEVPITFVEREKGQSKMTLEIALEALVVVTRKSNLLTSGKSKESTSTKL